MKLEVCIISREIIKPSSSTPNHLRIYKLSHIDQSNFNFFVPFTLFYSRGPKSSDQLKKSLSKILTYYYPFAGRVKDNFIDSDDNGVSFVEAHVAGDMSEVLKKPEIDLLQQLLPYQPREMSAIEFNLAIQINYFESGGVAISFCFGHFIVDAAAVAHFIRSWAMVACGGDDTIKDISLFPSHDWLVLPTSNIDQEIVNIITIPQSGESELKEHSSGKRTKRFVFEKSKIMALQETFGSRVTRFEAMFVLMWSAIAATKLEEEEFVAAIAVNLRKRIDPPISEQCIGNICTVIISNWPKEEITNCNSLAVKLRELLRMVNDDYIRNALRKSMYLNFIRDHNVASSSNRKRFIFVSGCSKLPFYEADFGWGKPVWFAFPNSEDDDNICVSLFDASDGEGIEAWVEMSKEQMAKFEKDPTVIAYASFNPST
ncbi:hypothetical protein QYF36_025867 [Acer negundo]|nr:hypothetical protein QYF36_025867 [Acer negundo]